MADYTAAELLALTPKRYLADGFCDAAGKPRRELTGEYATAACQQLLSAEAAAQEISLTVEAVAQVLPLQDDATPGFRVAHAVQEALGVIEQALQQTNNEGIVEWLIGCGSAVRTDADVQAFLAHLRAVDRQYALIAALQPSS